ncbi:MAG: cache domain-containing protein [Alphaproteobacteria bacterium]|nr:cache domain-containing protein [Alphaproteobacteria bacterium]
MFVRDSVSVSGSTSVNGSMTANNSKSIRNFKINTRLLFIVILSAVGMLVVGWYGLSVVKQTLVEARQIKTRHLVESTYSLINHYVDMEKNGIMTKEQAQDAAKSAVKKLRYEESDYFWINDMKPVMVMHPMSPQLNGKDLSDFKDPNGKRIFVEFANTVRNHSEGFVNYMWAKPGEEKPVDKLSYVKGIRSWDWIIGSGIYIDDINKIFMEQVYKVGSIILGILVIASAISLFISRGITIPLSLTTQNMMKLAEGNKNIEVKGTHYKDEVGDLARTLEVFKKNSIEMDRLEAERKEAEEKEKLRKEEERKEEEKVRQLEEEKRKKTDETISDFTTNIANIVETISSAATEMQATAQSMASISEETSSQATSVAAASEEATANVATVASATEELSASIAEIGQQVEAATSTSLDAVEKAKNANKLVQGLSEAATKIGDVVSMITDIANQTNLLALNATIEAARAGDMGKGFAVVASEVKNLAGQTAKATEEIASQITGIQDSTATAVDAIQLIGNTIEEINVTTTTIASSVDEQSAAATEISRNIQEAANGTQEVTSNVVGLNQSAQETGNASNDVLKASEELGKQATGLKEEVEGFIQKLNAV